MIAPGLVRNSGAPAATSTFYSPRLPAEHISAILESINNAFCPPLQGQVEGETLLWRYSKHNAAYQHEILNPGEKLKRGISMRIFIAFLKVIGVLLLILILLAAGFGAGVCTGVYYALTPAGAGKPVRVDVKEGETAAGVAGSLEQNGVIRNALLFRMAMKLTHSDAQLKPGSYLIDPGSNMMEIITQLKKGNFKLRLVTIPEGLTVKEMAKLFEKKGVAKERDILNAAKEKAFTVNGRKLDNLEGFLMPDTYDFPDEYTAEDVLKTMISAFDKNVVPMYKRQKNILPHKLTLTQVVTLASMIEREAQVPSERPMIAMVYYNRLNKGMKMECDATIQFALGKPKQILKFSDLKIKSPYNTYLHNGLPPGPIANPGMESIRGALFPAQVDYLFYVRNDVKNDGSHAFSRTFQGHNENIKKYQK